jgi:ppGpp synthetase/RelA/SpoT-type nucleotidyltranferase
MITPSEINSKFNLIKPYLLPLQLIVRETLSVFCEEKSFALVSRVKSLESLSEKIESGRYASWSEIDDLIAFAIVIPTLLEEEMVIRFLEETFLAVALKRRGSTLKPPDVFRFDSTRFAAKLKPPPGEIAARPIDQIMFEVQVRTAFDHAWVVTTHAFAYKTPIIDWKQQRLAAELKATAEKMDLLIVAFNEASIRVEQSPWPLIDAKRLIHEFFTAAARNKKLPQELMPKDWSRFIDNVYDLGKHCDRKLKPEQIAILVTEAVEKELDILGPEKVPLSLSLWQFTLASLVKEKAFKSPMTRYWPLITPELEELYPSARELSPRFDLGR